MLPRCVVVLIDSLDPQKSVGCCGTHPHGGLSIKKEDFDQKRWYCGDKEGNIWEAVGA
jgi:hypothetical protein